jgi:hypothetical protein
LIFQDPDPETIRISISYLEDLYIWNVQGLLYSGLLEELVELLEMKGDHLMEIKAGLAIKKPTQKTLKYPKKPH